MLSRLTRDLIDADHITRLRTKINSLAEQYKQANKPSGFSLFGDNHTKTYKIVDSLQVEVNKLAVDLVGSAFEKYHAILKSLQTCLNNLDEKKDSELYQSIQSILVSRLRLLDDAEWSLDQEDIDWDTPANDQYDAAKINRCINASLVQLNRPAFTSIEEKRFADKWNESGGQEQFPIWKFMVEKIDFYLNNGNGGAFVGDVKALAGIEVKKRDTQSVGISKLLRGEVQYHVSDADDRKQEDLPRFVSTIVTQAREALERFQIGSLNDAKAAMIEDFLEKIKYAAARAHKGKNYAENYINLVGSLLDMSLDLPREEINKQKEIKKIIEKCKNEGLDNSTLISIEAKMIPIEKALKIKLEIRQVLKDLKDYDGSKDLGKLNRMVNFIKKDAKKSNDTKQIFTSDLHQKISCLEQQVSIMNGENLKTLATDYMQRFTSSTYKNKETINETARVATSNKKKFVKTFLQTLIEEVINPLRDMFNMSRLDKYSFSGLKTIQGNITKSQEQRKSQGRTLFFFGEKSVEKYDDFKVDRLSATELTRYADFKSDICQWLININQDMLSNESYPSIEEFWEIETKYRQAKQQAVQPGSKDALNLFFTNNFSYLLAKRHTPNPF